MFRSLHPEETLVARELYHLLVCLLDYCTSKLQTGKSGPQDESDLLHETVVFLGFYCLNKEDNQGIMCYGEGPTFIFSFCVSQFKWSFLCLSCFSLGGQTLLTKITSLPFCTTSWMSAGRSLCCFQRSWRLVSSPRGTWRCCEMRWTSLCSVVFWNRLSHRMSVNKRLGLRRSEVDSLRCCGKKLSSFFPTSQRRRLDFFKEQNLLYGCQHQSPEGKTLTLLALSAARFPSSLLVPAPASLCGIACPRAFASEHFCFGRVDGCTTLTPPIHVESSHGTGSLVRMDWTNLAALAIPVSFVEIGISAHEFELQEKH